MKIHDYLQRRGKHCFIHKISDSVALKIFDVYPQENFNNLDDFTWGDPPKDGGPRMSVGLMEASIIQNYAAMHGLAPRVLDIVGVRWGNNKYFAQKVEYVNGIKAKDHDEAAEVYAKVANLGNTYGFEVDKADCSDVDVIGGQLVDFNTFHFTNNHLDKIKELYIKKAKYGKVYYHGVPEWGLTGGPRDNLKRVEYMKLPSIDFAGKSVVDLGCAGGFFTRYAKDRGAKRIAGIDMNGEGGGDPVDAAKIVSNELGYWDIRYENHDLRNVPNKYDGMIDIIFFLSMNYHIGIPEWLPSITRELLIFEDNSKNRDAKVTLEKMFDRVKLVGYGKDHGDKLIYHCYK